MGPKVKVFQEPDVNVPDGDPAQGRAVFDANCTACHVMEGKSESAPTLGGVLGRKAGSTQFLYSKAMKTSGIVWSKKHLFKYIQNPSKYIPGNRMAFAGIQNEADLGNLIAYLEAN